jgi:hypothetical protein
MAFFVTHAHELGLVDAAVTTLAIPAFDRRHLSAPEEMARTAFDLLGLALTIEGETLAIKGDCRII